MLNKDLVVFYSGHRIGEIFHTNTGGIQSLDYLVKNIKCLTDGGNQEGILVTIIQINFLTASQYIIQQNGGNTLYFASGGKYLFSNCLESCYLWLWWNTRIYGKLM